MATIPSSPPVRITRPQSRSCSPSNYSLDLDRLMPSEDESEVKTPPRYAHIDVVRTDEIDGPSDFTQNLEYWMTTKLLPSVTQPLRAAGEAKDNLDLEEYVSGRTEQQSHVRVEEIPKKDSLLDTETPRKQGEDMGSWGNTSSSIPAEHAQISTPTTVEYAPTSKNKDFQASVEDHDDTPSRIRESSSAIGATLRSPEFTMRNNPDFSLSASNQSRVEESETVKSLRQALNKLRGELDDVRSTSEREIRRIHDSYERLSEERLSEHQSQMQAQEREWKRRLSSARLERAAQEQAVKQQQELQTIAEQMAVKDARIKILERGSENQDQELQAAKDKCSTIEQERDALIENLRATIQAHEKDQRLKTNELLQGQTEVEGLKAKLDKLQESKVDSESKLQSLQAEIANLTLEHANEIEDLTTRIEDATNATQRANFAEQESLQGIIKELEQENGRLHAQLDGKDDEIDALRDDAQQMRLSHAATMQEKEELANKLKAQKTLNDQAAREIQSLRSGNKILQARLADVEKTFASNAELETLEVQLAQANATRLESDVEVDNLKTQLQELKKSLAISQAELLAARGEFEAYKADSESVNKAMDKQIQKLMRAREAEWTKRLQALRTEMGFRGEVLMREWGKAEVGTSEPQGYRYKFV